VLAEDSLRLRCTHTAHTSIDGLST
jgi:hypothetical protein